MPPHEPTVGGRVKGVVSALREMMPRFFFHVKDGVRLVDDDVGKELESIAEARREGERLASEVRSEITKPTSLVKELRVEVQDEAGKVVATISLDQVSSPESS